MGGALKCARERPSLRGGLLACARLEAVLGLTGHSLQVAHTASTSRAPANGLLAPLVAARLGARVAARATLLVLLVERTLAAATAESVSLDVAETERRRTASHVAEELRSAKEFTSRH